MAQRLVFGAVSSVKPERERERTLHTPALDFIATRNVARHGVVHKLARRCGGAGVAESRARAGGGARAPSGVGGRGTGACRRASRRHVRMQRQSQPGGSFL
jgi:hypothetical protein